MRLVLKFIRCQSRSPIPYILYPRVQRHALKNLVVYTNTSDFIDNVCHFCFLEVIPDAVRTKCAKCSPKQKVLIRKVVRGFQEELPQIWSDLVKQEDPKGLYKTEFDNFLNGSD